MKYLKTYESFIITLKIDVVPDNAPNVIPDVPDVITDGPVDLITSEVDDIPNEVEGDDLVNVVMTGDDLDILSEKPNVNVEK